MKIHNSGKNETYQNYRATPALNFFGPSSFMKIRRVLKCTERFSRHSRSLAAPTQWTRSRLSKIEEATFRNPLEGITRSRDAVNDREKSREKTIESTREACVGLRRIPEDRKTENSSSEEDLTDRA